MGVSALGLQMLCRGKYMKNKANASKIVKNFCTSILHIWLFVVLLYSLVVNTFVMYYLQGVNTVSYWDDHFKIIVINLSFYLLSPSFWTVTNISQYPDLLEPICLIKSFSFNIDIIRSPCRKESERESATSFTVIRLLIRISSNVRYSFIPTF